MPDYNDLFTYGVRTLHATMENENPSVVLYRDRYFSNTIESLDEMIRIELRRKGNLVLPSVRRGDNAINLGDIAEHQVRQYMPPYHYFKASVTAEDTKKRVFGEPLETPYSREERAQAILAEKLYLGAQRSLLLMQESYCAQVLKTGKLKAKRMTYDGTLYDDAEIDFGCDTTNLVGVDKTGDASTKWTTSSDIISQLKDLCLAVFSASGKMPTEIVVGSTVLSTIFGNKDFIKYYDTRRVEGGLLETIPMANYPGASVAGYVNIPAVGNIRILTYVNSYKYKSSSAVDMIGTHDVLVTTPGWGSMGYGALNDQGDSGYPNLVPGKVIIHTELGRPSNGFAVTGYIQSAPIPVPTELDAWGYFTVTSA